jgi:long-chain acyl-CoA synthetase
VNAFTSAGSLAPESFRFLRALGLNIKQVYGSSEAPIISFHRDGDVKFHSVGPKGCDELAITEEGEIIVKDSGLFVDYYKDPEATKESLRDGWFHTGDAGYLDDDGHLIFWDRLSDLRQLKGGARFSPLYIESRLRFSPYISDAICVGGDKEYVAVLIAIDFENVGRWAERRKIPYTTFVDLSQRPEVIDLVKGEVQVVNDTLPEWSKVLKLVNLPKELDPDEAELTRTRKLRRAFVEERYSEIIEAIYEGMQELSTQVKVQYRDGTERVIQFKLEIVNT